MNTLLFVSERMITETGFALLHSLWQAGFIALAVFVLLKLMKNLSASARYAMAFFGLALCFLLPAAAIWRAATDSVTSETTSTVAEADNLVTVMYVLADTGFGVQSMIQSLRNYFLQLSHWFVLFWLIGMLLMITRLAGGYVLAWRLKTTHLKQLDREYLIVAERLALKLGIRKKVRIFESYRVDIPVVIGYLKPVVLLPAGLLTRIPYDQLEIILAHELAHIRRADFLINLIQSLIEVMLFFNPFVWWISQVIRHERENVCDDMALSLTGKGITLAKALLSLSECKNELNNNQAVMYFNKTNTMKRIERLFRNPKTKPSNPEKILVSLIAFIVVLVISASGTIASDNRASTSQFSMTDQTEITYLNDISLSQPDTLKKKEIYIEMKDGRINKAIVDGKEVPADKLENEDFVIMEKDTSVMKRIVLKNAHPKYNSMVIETNELEWHQKPKDTLTMKSRKIIIDRDADQMFMVAPDKAGKPFMFHYRGQEKNDSLRFIYEDSDSFVQRAKVLQWDTTGRSMLFEGGTLDSLMKQLKPLIDQGIVVDRNIMLSRPGDPLIMMNFDDQRRIIEMEQQARKFEAEAQQMEAGNKKEEILRQAEALRLEMEARRLEMESRRPELMLRGPEPRIIIGEDIPDLREIELLIDRAAPAPEHGFDRKHLRLLKDELLEEGMASKKSTIIITRKQTIIDGNIAEQKNHKRMLKRLEEISGKKLGADQAVTIR
jgi:beta-lactamase regulating signal transducer with metallopeptidase domain